MTTAAPAQQAVLSLACPDRPGIVHAVSGFLVQRGCTIHESQQYDDPDSGRFFMRTRFGPAGGGALDIQELYEAFAGIAREWKMTWRLVDPAIPTRVIIMVSKYAHCLNDLLFRNSVGELNLDVTAVVSNHPDLGRLADDYRVPFLHIPVTSENKPEAEAQLLELAEAERVELVVLARYMQVLSDNLCRQLEGRMINIHHSMLPAFKGARPYHQAHARGVKVIGATSHYVTADLDEGQIIDQEIEKVDHSMTAEDFASRGRELENRALARAVQWHSENRVILNGNRTVILR
jgi:formyltetrahydrofolate deformylase